MHHHATYSDYTSFIPLLLITALLTLYLLGVIALLREGRSWNNWRTISFASGMILLLIAMLPPMVQFAQHDIRGHMAQHLLVGMFAPLGLVLGAPVTLALKTLPANIVRMITGILGSSFFHFISHPLTALLLNIGGMFILYLTPLYNATFTNSWLHHLIHVHFLAAGYLYTWAIAGLDPAPRRPGFRLRVVVLFCGIAAHAYLSKYMYAYLLPLNSPHPDEQLRSAAKLMYYGGDVSELLLTIALFAAWYQKQRHPKYKENPLFM